MTQTTRRLGTRMMAVKAASGWRARARTIGLGAVLVVVAFDLAVRVSSEPLQLQIPRLVR